MAFIKHVGKHGDRKVAVVFRKVPGEDHMALVVYMETLPSNFHDAIIETIESNAGQSAAELAEALDRAVLNDGRNLLQAIHAERYMKKVQTNQRDGLYVGDKPSKWELIDTYTLKITLPSVYAGIFNLSTITPVPKHIFKPLIDKKGHAAVNSFWGVDADVKTIVSCGQFVLDEYVPSQKVVINCKFNQIWHKAYLRGDASCKIVVI